MKKGIQFVIRYYFKPHPGEIEQRVLQVYLNARFLDQNLKGEVIDTKNIEAAYDYIRKLIDLPKDIDNNCKYDYKPSQLIEEMYYEIVDFDNRFYRLQTLKIQA